MEHEMTEDHPYEAAVAAGDAGMDPGAVQKLAERFLHQYEQGMFPGGQLVVRRNGKVVIKQPCGLARGWQGRGGAVPVKVRDDTPFPVYSTGKPMAAIVLALLEARGVLDAGATVASVLPEFGGMGRDEITILDVLTHRGGIIVPDLIKNHKINGDRDAAWHKLLQTPPRYPRGTFAYMPTEYGTILDQLVTRLTGQTIAQQFRNELALPLGLHNIHYGLGSSRLDELAWSYWLGKDRYVVADMDVADRFEEKNNDPAVFSAGNPAFGMVADAASLAALYEFLVNGGRAGDRQLIPGQLVQRCVTRQVSGWNKSLKTYASVGRGFLLGTRTPSLYGWWGTSGCFGHPGMFSSLAYGDHDTGLAVAIVTNGNKGMGDMFSRFIKITHGLRMACR